MKKVIIDIREHSSSGLKRMICSLEPRIVEPILVCSMARKHCRDIKDNGGFFVGERVLRCGFMRESIKPIPISFKTDL